VTFDVLSSRNIQTNQLITRTKKLKEKEKGSGREMMHENYPHRSCPLLVSSTRLTTLRVLVVATPLVMA